YSAASIPSRASNASIVHGSWHRPRMHRSETRTEFSRPLGPGAIVLRGSVAGGGLAAAERTSSVIRRSVPRGTICLGPFCVRIIRSCRGGFRAAAVTLSTCTQAVRLERAACRNDLTGLRERDAGGIVGRGCRLGPRAISVGPPRTVPLRRRVRRILRAATASQDRGQAALDGRARNRLWLSAGQLHSWPIRDPVRSLSDQSKPPGR